MIAHDPGLVILSVTIAILGAFTASVMTSGIGALSLSEGRMRIVMAAVTLGSSIWATHFVGLLAIEAPVNFAYDPLLLALSAVSAFAGTAVALFLLWPKRNNSPARLAAAVIALGLAIAITNYLGIFAIAGRGLELSWFLTAICFVFSLQTAFIVLWFLFRRSGVALILIGSIALGLSLTAAHYLAIQSTNGLEETLLTLPRNTSGISGRYLAWAATIMTYLICSICLSIFVITQFREENE
ncbi:MAG: MHYT domain-containing protein [Rhodomicrobium sp.]